MRDVVINCMGDCPAERLQLLDCVLRHDAQRRWKLGVLKAVAFQLCVLERDERFGLLFGFKESALALSGLAVVYHVFQMRTITVAISANPALALSHPLRCRLVAVNSSNFALLCEFMCYNDS